MALAAPGIRIDGFTGRFRLYAWDNGRRSEPLFAAGRKYASVLAPLFHGNAPEPQGPSPLSPLSATRKAISFPPPYSRAAETKFGRFLQRKGKDLYRDRMRRAAGSVSVSIFLISVISFNSMNLYTRLTLELYRNCSLQAVCVTYDRVNIKHRSLKIDCQKKDRCMRNIGK